ncbi:MAG TPA: DUF5658 family protein, partial [Candidatus Acidoferrales bacterium]|nr:DUF5658 family protein [Candidatus Acidoferrales bacterium]
MASSYGAVTSTGLSSTGFQPVFCGLAAVPHALNPSGFTIIVALGLVGLAAALLDMFSTAYILDRGGRELNPLARPFTRLPRGAYYATGILGVVFLALLGWYMRARWPASGCYG